MTKGYLINDFLTCIPGTTTFWHDLLDWTPTLQPKCNGDYKTIVEYANLLDTPDYIIRNASWFEPLNHKCTTIAVLQDPLTGKHKEQQIRVCKSSDVVVCNTHYVYEMYKEHLTEKDVRIIPLGTDFNHFKPLTVPKKYDVIFVGADNDIKNFALVREIINTNKTLTFCIVMKYPCKEKFGKHCTVFSQVNHNTLLQLYNQSKMLICTSKQETQHLAGIEAGACDIPIVATNVGIYPYLKGNWGIISEPNVIDFNKNIKHVLHNHYTTRQSLIEAGLDKDTCKQSWTTLLQEITQ